MWLGCLFALLVIAPHEINTQGKMSFFHYFNLLEHNCCWHWQDSSLHSSPVTICIINWQDINSKRINTVVTKFFTIIGLKFFGIWVGRLPTSIGPLNILISRTYSVQPLNLPRANCTWLCSILAVWLMMLLLRLVDQLKKWCWFLWWLPDLHQCRGEYRWYCHCCCPLGWPEVPDPEIWSCQPSDMGPASPRSSRSWWPRWPPWQATKLYMPFQYFFVISFNAWCKIETDLDEKENLRF